MALSKDPEKRKRQMANLKPMKKGDLARSAGRPRNLFGEAVARMEQEVGQIPTREDIIRSLFFCVSAGEEKLKSWVNDKNQPMIIRICAKEVLGGKGFEAIGKILDRVVGRSIDVTSQGEKIKTEPTVIEVVGSKDFIEKLND